MTNKAKVLLVDDEVDILEFLKYNLAKENFNVETASNGNEAIEKALLFIPDLIILDIMMPGMDGIKVCQELRSKDLFKDTLIAFLTARGESFTQVSALDNGGDDFIVKPIRPNVLVSRVKALIRRKLRNQLESGDQLVEFGDLKIDSDKFQASVNGTEINLAKKEFELLNLLTSKPGKVFKRHEILNSVWGSEVIVGDRTIDVHIRKLRKKIGSHYIETLKGVGYKFIF